MITNSLVFPDGLNSKTLTVPFPGCAPISKLDERYFAFAASLPFPLDRLAVDRRMFTGKGNSQPISSLREIYSLATALPWLFADAFPTLSEAELLNISDANTLLVLSILLQDHYLDNQLPPDPGIPLLQDHLYTAALQKLFQLFDSRSSFWLHFNRYFSQYTTALTEESSHIGLMVHYPLQRAYAIGSGKMALHKTTMAAIALKAGLEYHLPLLEKALDALYAAMQLGDDVTDWKEDFERDRYTLPLTWVIPSNLWPVPHLTVAEINIRFEDSLILETLVKQVIEWFEDAKISFADLSCPQWNQYVYDYQTIMRAYQQALVAKKVMKIMSS